ncbi:hypothetical protein ACKN8S_05345 [Limosilactobacillus reuteri]|uniref:hypothetical protein n=1 Tax=Limosilactobacillus reuteri TaxID=1598 RepID=UPI0039BFFD70
MELDTQLNASDRNTRETISKNFQKIQDEDAKDDGAFQKFQSDANSRMDQLDQEKATHEDVNDLRDELLKKIKHIILGTDEETVKTVIQEMKKEGTI